MSQDPSVAAGNVNKLITFFEGKGDEKAAAFHRPVKRSSLSKQEVFQSNFHPPMYYKNELKSSKDENIEVLNSQTLNCLKSTKEDENVRKIPRAYLGEIIVTESKTSNCNQNSQIQVLEKVQQDKDYFEVNEKNKISPFIYDENNIKEDKFTSQSIGTSRSSCNQVKSKDHDSIHEEDDDSVKCLPLIQEQNHDLTYHQNGSDYYNQNQDDEFNSKKTAHDDCIDKYQKEINGSECNQIEIMERQLEHKDAFCISTANQIKKIKPEDDNELKDDDSLYRKSNCTQLESKTEENLGYSNPQALQLKEVEENNDSLNISGKESLCQLNEEKDEHVPKLPKNNIGFEHLQNNIEYDKDTSYSEASDQKIETELGDILPANSELRNTRKADELTKSPSVFPAIYWDPEVDCNQLNKALKGLNIDFSTVINILFQRSQNQRLEIIQLYDHLFQKSLVSELQKVTKGDLENLFIAMLTSLDEYLAKELHKSVKGIGTNEDTLIDILCVYEEDNVMCIQETYEKLFKKSLKDDIYEDTSGDFRKILLSILSTKRQDPAVKPSSVAAQLCEKNEKGKSTLDSEMLCTVLTSCTSVFLRDVVVEYEAITAQSLEDTIALLYSGDAKKAILTLYSSCKSIPKSFANQIYCCFRGCKRDDSKLIRVLVSRCEEDLEYIKEEYNIIYGVSLEATIEKETSGNYRDALLALINSQSV